MFQAHIRGHAPAAERPSSGLLGWAREIWGSERSRARIQAAFGEQILARLEGVGRGLEAAGLGDAVHVFADDRALYLDPGQNPADLEVALAKTLASDALDSEFSTLRLVCSAVDDAIHLLADVQIRGRRTEREEWLSVRLAARAPPLVVRKGDRAGDYRRRILEQIRREGELDEMLGAVDTRASRLARALQAGLPGHRIESDPATVRLIRTGTKQVGRFRNLGFESAVRSPTYRSQPTHKRSGAYDSPFFYYYFDPYQDLLHWIVVEDMFQHGTWASPRVEVVDRTGARLFTGDHAAEHASDRFEVPRGAVRFEDGALRIDAAIPLENSMDPVEVGSPYTPGFGGESGG